MATPDMRDEDREILDSLFFRLENGHRIGRRGRFKADREENHFFGRVGARDL